MSNPFFEHLRGKRLGLFTDMAKLAGEFEAFNDIRNLCRLCGNTTNPNQRFSIFSDYWKSVKLHRLISDVAKVSVTYDDLVQADKLQTCRILLEGRLTHLAFAAQRLLTPPTVLVLNIYRAFRVLLGKISPLY